MKILKKYLEWQRSDIILKRSFLKCLEINTFKKYRHFLLLNHVQKTRWALSSIFFFTALFLWGNGILQIYPSLFGHHFFLITLVIFFVQPFVVRFVSFVRCLFFGTEILLNIALLPMQFVVLIVGVLIAAAIFFSGRDWNIGFFFPLFFILIALWLLFDDDDAKQDDGKNTETDSENRDKEE